MACIGTQEFIFAQQQLETHKRYVQRTSRYKYLRTMTSAGSASVGKTLWSRYGVSVAWGPSPSPPKTNLA